jgi:hypothetical protein
LERESEAKPFTQADMDDLVAAWKNLPNIDADTMLDPDEFPPTCQNYEVSAPQRDGGATGGSPSVVSAFTQWCTDMDGQTVSKTGVDTAFKMTAFSFYRPGYQRMTGAVYLITKGVEMLRQFERMSASPHSTMP